MLIKNVSFFLYITHICVIYDTYMLFNSIYAAYISMYAAYMQRAAHICDLYVVPHICASYGESHIFAVQHICCVINIYMLRFLLVLYFSQNITH